MGCTASTASPDSGFTVSSKPNDAKWGRESSSSSPAAASPPEPSLTRDRPMPSSLSLPRWNVDVSQCEKLSREWVKGFGVTDGGERATPEMVAKDALSLLKSWPRGELAGQLLSKPIRCTAPIKERGVKLAWFTGAWRHMTANTNRQLISTRMFVELFVRPMLLTEGCNDNDPTLYDFIPLEFRSTPSVYVCHPWDGYLKHILFFPESLRKTWPADPSLWVDFIATSQLDDGPCHERLPEIKETVQSISRTVVVFPGDGTPSFAILPVTRSWCVYEILNTPKDQMDFRVGLHGDLNDVDFHSKVVQLIEGLTVEKAKATFATDKRAIDEALAENGEVQNNTALQAITRLAFAKRYESVPTTPTISQRLSGNSQISRMGSMSEIYTMEEIRLEVDESKNPDF